MREDFLELRRLIKLVQKLNKQKKELLDENKKKEVYIKKLRNRARTAKRNREAEKQELSAKVEELKTKSKLQS